MGDGVGAFSFWIAMAVIGASFFAAVTPVIKAFADRISGGNADRIAELEARLLHLEERGLTSGEVEAAYGRLAEMEERVEFTERMIAGSSANVMLGDAVVEVANTDEHVKLRLSSGMHVTAPQVVVAVPVNAMRAPRRASLRCGQ